MDSQGSTLALSDGGGTATTSYTYDPFGQTTVTGASSNALQYTSRENDGTGLYYYRARYYSPTLHRFISEDPIGLDGGDENFYAYTFNSPTNFTDPSGTIVPLIPPALACLRGAASSLAADALSGRKPNFTEAALGCATGGANKAFSAAKAAAKASNNASKFVAKDGTKITGHTKHGINRAIGDGDKRAGVKPTAFLDALKNPKTITSGVDDRGRPFRVFESDHARVVVNPETGKIVSQNPLSGLGVR